MQIRLTLFATLLASLSLLGVGAQPNENEPTRFEQRRQSTSLHKQYTSKHGKYFGCALDFNQLTGTPANVAKAQFGMATPGNALKWQFTEPQRGKFTFTEADKFMSFAKASGMRVRGHTLVWYSQLAPWVNSVSTADDIKKVMQNHISTIMGRYKGQVYAWDVVNEAFNEDGTFRKNIFYNLLGEDYIPLAFKLAKAADPKAKLYINDYNLDSASYAKTKGLIAAVKKWRAAGVPIDGIGSQMHLNAAGFPDASQVGGAMKALCAAAPECAITELDIKTSPSNSWVKAVQSCTNIANCVGVSQWGVGDADSWRKDDKPLLFDLNYKPKQAYSAVVNSM